MARLFGRMYTKEQLLARTGDISQIAGVRMFEFSEGPQKGDAALGVYVRFNSRQLPWLNEWKMMGERDYVVGIEPATNAVRGRAAERASRRLITLEPGETMHYNLEMGALTSTREINAFRREVRSLG